FHNPDNGFTVMIVQPKERGKAVTIVGEMPTLAEGEDVEITGDWVQDKKFGPQFRAEHVHTAPPHTVEGIERFLCSGLIKGIGRVHARKIVATFGDRTLQVLDESPTFLSEVKGLGKKRIKQIRESWEQHRAVRGIMLFLHSQG